MKYFKSVFFSLLAGLSAASLQGYCYRALLWEHPETKEKICCFYDYHNYSAKEGEKKQIHSIVNKAKKLNAELIVENPLEGYKGNNSYIKNSTKTILDDIKSQKTNSSANSVWQEAEKAVIKLTNAESRQCLTLALHNTANRSIKKIIGTLGKEMAETHKRLFRELTEGPALKFYENKFLRSDVFSRKKWMLLFVLENQKEKTVEILGEAMLHAAFNLNNHSFPAPEVYNNGETAQKVWNYLSTQTYDWTDVKIIQALCEARKRNCKNIFICAGAYHFTGSTYNEGIEKTLETLGFKKIKDTGKSSDKEPRLIDIESEFFVPIEKDKKIEKKGNEKN